MNRKTYCNERIMIPKDRQDRIAFEFVTGETRTLRIGDIDPVSGERITEQIVREYHRVRTAEIHRTLRAERVPFTEEELAARRKEREEIAAEFEEAHGRKPSKDDVRYIQDERWGNRYNLHMDALYDDNGEFRDDRLINFHIYKNDGDEDSDTAALRAFAETLSGRMRDVYELMLEKCSGGAGARTGKEVAERWGVCPATIVKDEARIRKMIAALFAERRR